MRGGKKRERPLMVTARNVFSSSSIYLQRNLPNRPAAIHPVALDLSIAVRAKLGQQGTGN